LNTFASRARRESSAQPAHCPEIRPSIAGFPANGCSQTSRHPVEAVSDRNMGKAGRWLRESTGTSSRNKAEQILIRRLAELGELLNAAEAIVSRSKIETPNLMLVGQQSGETVGKVSEMKRGLTKKYC